MSYTIQKWDNNTAEIVYKLYAFDSDFVIQKEVLAGNLIESTYYNSNVSRETMAAAWTARASKTYDYKLKENLVDNRFNRNFLALQDSYSCSLFESARKGINIKVEDFPLLWIEGNGGSGYYDSYKGDTFEISGSGCVYGGSVSDYDAVISIDLENKSLTTNFTDVMLSKFVSLSELICRVNSISILNVANLTSLTYLNCRTNSISTLDVSNLTSLTYLNCTLNSISVLNVTDLTSLITLSCRVNSISVLNVANLTSLIYLSCANNLISILNVSNLTSLTTLICNSNSISVLDVSNLTSLTFLRCHTNSISILDVSNLTSLIFLACDDNELTAAANSQILVDFDVHGLSNGYFQGSIFGGGSLTTAGAAAKTSLQGKGWSIVGL